MSNSNWSSLTDTAVSIPQTGSPTSLQISSFAGGLNRLAEGRSLPPQANCVYDCKNVEFLKNGFIQKSKGYIKAIQNPLNTVTSQIQGLYSFVDQTNQRWLLAVSGDKLYSSNNNGVSFLQIYNGLDSSRKSRFATFTNKVIIANGSQILEWTPGNPLAIDATTTWWKYSEIPSILKVHKNRLFCSGSLSATSRVWASGLQDLNFQVGDFETTGSGTVSTRKNTQITGSGTVSVRGGSNLVTGTGTVSVSGTVVTGVGTTFTKQARVGDTLIIGSNKAVITVITNDISMTILSGFTVSSQPYTIQPTQGQSFQLVGTISSSGLTVTGSSTGFTVQLAAGDTISVSGYGSAVVSRVISNTSLQITTPFTSSVPGGSIATVNRIGSGNVTTNSTGGFVSQGTGGKFLSELSVGCGVQIEDEVRTVIFISDDLTASLDKPFKINYTNVSFKIINPSRLAVIGKDTQFFTEASLAGVTTGYKITIGSETKDIQSIQGSGLLVVEEAFTNNYTDQSYAITVPDQLETTLVGIGTSFTTDFNIGDNIKLADGQTRTIISVTSNTELQIAAKLIPEAINSSFSILKPNNNPGDFFDVNGADGLYVSGMEVYAENLIIFKNRSIWALSGSTVGSIINSADPFKLTPVSASTGCISPDSIVAVNNDIFFLNEYGAQALSLVNRLIQPIATNLLTTKIQPDIDAWNVNQLPNTFGIHYRAKQQVWFFIPGNKSSFQNDKVIIIDYQMQNITIRDGFVGSCGTDFNDKPLVGGYNGYLYQHDTGDSYDGQAIESFFTTPWYSIDNNYLSNKRILTMNLTFIRYGSWSLNLEVGINWLDSQRSRIIPLSPASANPMIWDITDWDEANWVGIERTTKTLYDFGMGKVFNFKFTNNGIDQPWLIEGIDCRCQTLSDNGSDYQKTT